MIAEQCAHIGQGAKLNAPCRTCGHTLGAHTVDMRCDVCAVVLDVRHVLMVMARRIPDDIRPKANPP